MTIISIKAKNENEQATLWILVFLYGTPSTDTQLAYRGCSTMIRGKYNDEEFSKLLNSMIDDDLIEYADDKFSLTLRGILATQNRIFNHFDKLKNLGMLNKFKIWFKKKNQENELIEKLFNDLQNSNDINQMESTIKQFSIQNFPLVLNEIIPHVSDYLTRHVQG